MMHPLAVAALAATLSIAGGQARAQPADAPLLDCTTIFTKTSDEASLVQRFGRANVAAAMIGGVEGSSERGTVLFPKDPARRIEIVWHDVAKRRRPASVMVKGRSGWALAGLGGPDQRLALGQRLDAVAAMNGRPFLLNGFAWDLGGYSTGWKGGALDAIPGGCSLSVRFHPDPKSGGRRLDRVSGEKQFASSDAAIEAVRPTVSQLSLDWPE